MVLVLFSFMERLIPSFTERFKRSVIFPDGLWVNITVPLPRGFLKENQLGRTLCGRVKQTLALDLTRSLSRGWTVVSVHRHPKLTVCILGSGCATYSITQVAFPINRQS